MKTIKITPVERKVLLDSLNAVGWQSLPAKHPERKAFESLMRKLEVESE